MLYTSKVTPKGNSSYSYNSQAAAEANAKYLDDHGCTRCMDCTHCTGCMDCTGCTGCTDCTDCTGCTRCTGCTGEVIQAGLPNGWPCYGWCKAGELVIHCGCRRKTFAEAVEYWSNKPDRVEVLMACHYIASIAQARGWRT